MYEMVGEKPINENSGTSNKSRTMDLCVFEFMLW